MFKDIYYMQTNVLYFTENVCYKLGFPHYDYEYDK